MSYKALLAFLVIDPCVGCRAQQLANDQDHIRSAVLELESNQIMDNLIRIRKGLPIMQLDYNHMTGTVTQTVNGNVSGSETIVSRVVTSVVGYSASGQQIMQLTINAEPVLN